MKMFHTWRSRKVVTRFLFTLFSPPKSAKTYRGINLTDVRVTSIHEDNDTRLHNIGNVVDCSVKMHYVTTQNDNMP